LESLPKTEQLTQGVADANLDSGQDDGEWVVYAKKSKNRARSTAAKPWSPPVHNSRPTGNTKMGHKPVTRNDGGVGRASGRVPKC